MFKPLVVVRHKSLWSDDARISKIAGAVSETTDSADFKFFFALFRDNLVPNYFCLHFVGTVGPSVLSGTNLPFIR